MNLTSALAIYLLFRAWPFALVAMIPLLYGLRMADAAGAFAGLTWVTDWMDIGPLPLRLASLVSQRLLFRLAGKGLRR